MNKRTGLDWWSHRAWIKFSCIIAAVVTIMILINWENWSTELKVVASIAALIPIHVVEEWAASSAYCLSGQPAWFADGGGLAAGQSAGREIRDHRRPLLIDGLRRRRFVV